MAHVVLLGDSVLDNKNYVPARHDVVSLLATALPADDAATLLARDGAVIGDVLHQLAWLPPSATHLLISVGGNDALRGAAMLLEGASSMASAVLRIAEFRDGFARSYGAMLDGALASKRQIALCTIYDVPLPDPTQRRVAHTALSALNDVISREAVRRRLPLLDLRVMFDEPDDFANPIEPSAQGGRKIVRALRQLLAQHHFSGPSAAYI